METEPSAGPLVKWGLGIVVPLILVVHGLSALVEGRATMMNRGVRQALVGGDAIAYGIAVLGLAVGLFSHCFWATTAAGERVAPVGRAFGAVVFLGAVAFLAYRRLQLGF